MKVLVIGATGFTGSHTVPALRAAGHHLRCLVRPESVKRFVEKQPQVETVVGDLNDPKSVRHALVGMEAAITIASIGFGHAPALVDCLCKSEVRRVLFVSTTAIFTRLNSRSKAIRIAAESAIVNSGLDFTILRPTMIYGGRRDRNISRLIRFLRWTPIVPVIGRGQRLQQPIFVQNVADALVACLDHPITIGRCYNIAGACPLTFNEIIDTVCMEIGRRPAKLHLPLQPVVRFFQTMEKCGWHLPITSEQFLRLAEDKAFDYTRAVADFGFSPMGFLDGVRRQLMDFKQGGIEKTSADRNQHHP